MENHEAVRTLWKSWDWHPSLCLEWRPGSCLHACLKDGGLSGRVILIQPVFWSTQKGENHNVSNTCYNVGPDLPHIDARCILNYSKDDTKILTNWPPLITKGSLIVPNVNTHLELIDATHLKIYMFLSGVIVFMSDPQAAPMHTQLHGQRHSLWKPTVESGNISLWL